MGTSETANAVHWRARKTLKDSTALIAPLDLWWFLYMLSRVQFWPLNLNVFEGKQINRTNCSSSLNNKSEQILISILICQVCVCVLSAMNASMSVFKEKKSILLIRYACHNTLCLWKPHGLHDHITMPPSSSVIIPLKMKIDIQCDVWNG